MKKKKTIFLILFLLLAAPAGFLLLLLLLPEPSPHTIYYTDDYPELYKDQLQIIFGDNYQVGEKETIEIEEEDCGCGYHSDGRVYDQWLISYQDQQGQTFTQTLSNSRTLGSLQLSWLREQLEQHCLEKYIVEFFGEGTFDDPSCWITIGNPVKTWGDQLEEYKRIKEIGKNYESQLKQQLQKEGNLLHLADADYSYFFNHFPIKADFHLYINDVTLSEADKADLQKEVQEKILEMTQAFCQDTGNACNLSIYIASMGKDGLYDGSTYWRYYILQGELFELGEDFDYHDFDWKVFYSYEGIYW